MGDQKYIIGISGGFRQGYQDAAAVLLCNGQVVCAMEEERLTRIKHSPGSMPVLAIREVLHIAGITIRDVYEVGVHGVTWGNEYRQSVNDFFRMHFGYCPPLRFHHHHMAHAAGAYYSSGFTKSMILTMDNSGDGISTQLAIADGTEIQILESYARPQSLGIFYSLITQFCGFKKESDEYKLMGLAAYGKCDGNGLNDVLKITGDKRYSLNEKYLVQIPVGAVQPSRQQPLFSHELEKRLGFPPRLPGEELTDRYKNVAAEAQALFETAVLTLVKSSYEQTGLRRICLSGGAALNCVANGKIAALDFIDEIYIQPAAGDNGIAMGCAQLSALANGILPQKVTGATLGKSYTDADIEKALKGLGVAYQKTTDLIKETADLLHEGKIIGWFQGGEEFGPRALGNRSILAAATHKEMQQAINLKIKFRESFRPFCPAVLESDFKLYFHTGKITSAPYMNLVFKAREHAFTSIPAGIHADGTSRVQTVSSVQNPLFYNLLKAYKERSGVGVLLNTSFNRNNEPIVHTPQDAVSAFYGSGLDALLIGNYILRK